MTDKDGWITHDGGPCPVAPGRLVMVNDDITVALPVSAINWAAVTKYRTFARVNPPDPGPSPFVRDAAARIMAAIAVHGGSYPTDEKLAEAANRGIRAAKALEAALKEVKG